MYDTEEDIMTRGAAEVEWATGIERAEAMMEHPAFQFNDGPGTGCYGHFYYVIRLGEDDAVMDTIDEMTKGYDLIRVTITMRKGLYWRNRVWTVLVTHTSGCFEKTVQGSRS